LQHLILAFLLFFYTKAANACSIAYSPVSYVQFSLLGVCACFYFVIRRIYKNKKQGNGKTFDVKIIMLTITAMTILFSPLLIEHFYPAMGTPEYCYKKGMDFDPFKAAGDCEGCVAHKSPDAAVDERVQ
jgi:hypothetical protein